MGHRYENETGRGSREIIFSVLKPLHFGIAMHARTSTMKTKIVLLLLSIAFSLNMNTHAIAMTGHHHAPVAKTTVEVEGLNVAFGIHSSTGMAAGHEAMAEGSVREGEFADVVFHVTEEKTGEPVSSLELASWISLTNDKAESEVCEDRVKRYVQGLLGLHADIDLNKYFVLVMNDDATISVIDPIMGVSGITQLFDMIVLPERAEDWAASPGGEHLFVTMPRVGLVAKVDLQSFEVLETIDAGSVPVRAAVQPGGRYLWVGNDGMQQGGVTIIDIHNNEKLDFISTGGGHHEIAFSDDGRFAYITNGQDNTLSVIATDKLATVATIPTGENPIAVVYSPMARAVFVLSEADGTLTAVDADQHSVRYTIDNDPGPIALKFEPHGRWGFIANFRQNRVDIIDSTDGRIIHRVPVGQQPHQIVFSHMYAYVRHLGTPDVTLIKLSDLGREEGPAHHQIALGNAAPGKYRYTSLADSISPTGHMAMVIAANPSERILYHYMEGMMVPMGSYSTYGKIPRAVRVVDRSLREVEKGVYTGKIRVPKEGSYNVSLLVKSPRVIQCFRFDADPLIETASTDNRNGSSIGIDYIAAPRRVTIGETFTLKFQLHRDAGVKAMAGLEDVWVTAARMPGNRTQRALARHVGEGVYETQITLGEPGAYYAFVSIPSLGIDRSQLPYQMFRAEKKKDPIISKR